MILPNLRDEPLAAAALGLLAELRDTADIERSIVAITRDGEVDDSEATDWESIQRELGELYAAAMQLYCAGKKALARRTNQADKNKIKEEQKHA